MRPSLTTKHRRLGVGLLVAGALSLGFTYADYAPLVTLLSSDLAIDEVQAGLLSTALFSSYLISTFFTTGLPGRFGPKVVVGAGLLFALAGCTCMAIAPNYGVALVGKALQGVASALAFAAGNRYIVGLYAGQRAHIAVGLYGAGFPAGGALGLAAMPRLAGALGDWRYAFAAEAVAIGLIALAWRAAPSVVRIPRRGSIRDALRCANCWWTGVQHAGFGIAIASGGWITLFLLREFDLPLSSSGLLGSILLAVATCARPLGGLLVGRGWLRSRAAMVLANVLIIAGLALLILPGRPLVLALAGTTVVGLGAGLPFASIFNTAAASLRSAPAAAQGLPTIFGGIVVVAAAPLMGYAVRAVGFGAAWAVVLGVAVLALMATIVVRGEEDLP